MGREIRAGEKIAIGFHTCHDYELVWNTETIEQLIVEYGIHDADLAEISPIDSQRDMVVNFLYHLKEGIGCEVIPATTQICIDFANRFAYKETIGGTATRAAMGIQKIGYGSVVHMCYLDETMERLLPGAIQYISSIDVRKEVSPHVVLQCLENVRIKANDIDFVTPRENRVMCSRDMDSLEMKLTEDFIPLIQDAEVFLLSSFCEVLDFEILADRIQTTKKILGSLQKDALVVMEDADYISHEFRHYVHRELRSRVDILSMNEDELQDYVGRKLNMLDPGEVLEAVQQVAERTGIPYILVHSSAWALIYGKEPEFARKALLSATALSATRFRKGDDFGKRDFEETKRFPDKRESVAFCEKIAEWEQVCCVPSKDLSAVENPTVVGLGDYFAGGLLPELTAENRGPKI